MNECGQMSLWFAPRGESGRNQQYATVGGLNQNPGAQPRIFPMMGDPTGSLSESIPNEANNQSIATGRYILRNLRVKLDTPAGGALSTTFALRVNGLTTTLLVSIPDPSLIGVNLVNKVKLVPGDLIDWIFGHSINGSYGVTKAHLVWEEVPY